MEEITQKGLVETLTISENPQETFNNLVSEHGEEKINSKLELLHWDELPDGVHAELAPKLARIQNISTHEIREKLLNLTTRSTLRQERKNIPLTDPSKRQRIINKIERDLNTSLNQEHEYTSIDFIKDALTPDNEHEGIAEIFKGLNKKVIGASKKGKEAQDHAKKMFSEENINRLKEQANQYPKTKHLAPYFEKLIKQTQPIIQKFTQ